MISNEIYRFFRHSPLLSLSGAAILALGIGVSTLVLSLLFIFSSLSYPGMRKLAYATIAEETEDGGSIEISWNRFESLRSSPGQSTAIAAYSGSIKATMGVNGESKALRVAAISSGFFPIFTRGLLAGRDFNSAEEGDVGRHVVILGASTATELFGSPATALGGGIAINGSRYEIVGVAPKGFRGLFGEPVAAWVPANCVIPLMLNVQPGQIKQPSSWKEIASFYGIAASWRLDSTQLVAGLAHSLPLRSATEATLHVSQGLTVDPIQDRILRTWLRLGFLLTLAFTIVSSLNYSLLMLARAPRYVAEVQLKKALGANAVRLLAELIVGPSTMVVASVLAALVLWLGGVALVSRFSGRYELLLQRSWHVGLLAFVVQIPLILCVTLVVALMPALALLRNDGFTGMGYSSTTSRRSGRLLRIPVTVQIACCVGTWILTGMTVSSLMLLMRTPLGYDPSQLSVIRIGLSSSSIQVTTTSSFPTASAIESLLDRIAAVPGVQSAAYGSAPFDGDSSVLQIQRTDVLSATPRSIYQVHASGSYFHTLGAVITQGTAFSQIRGLGGLVINKSLARELWLDENPVGSSVKLIYPAFAGMPSSTQTAMVIGVVEDMRISGFSETPKPTIISNVSGASFVDIDPHIIVRGSASLHTLEDVATPIVSAEMPGLKVLSSYSVSEQARLSLIPEKIRAYSAMTGAALMALLSYIGLYGTLAYYVGTRRRDLAIRICYGASQWAVRRMVILQAARYAVIGTIMSLPFWIMLSRLSSSNYMGSIAWSSGRAAIISLACVFASILVSLVPAAAAASVSPVEALKER
jgi:putative ABC transport system permease protein